MIIGCSSIKKSHRNPFDSPNQLIIEFIEIGALLKSWILLQRGKYEMKIVQRYRVRGCRSGGGEAPENVHENKGFNKAGIGLIFHS
jgi:hypothetical protein